LIVGFDGFCWERRGVVGWCCGLLLFLCFGEERGGEGILAFGGVLGVVDCG